MARSPNSVRGVLRKVIARTSAGPDFRFSFGLRGSILDEQKKLDDNFPVLLPSNRSDDPPFPAFAQSSHFGLGGWNGGAQKLAPQEQRWVHQSRSANSSSFVLHPFILMGSRFASGGNIKDDKVKHDVTQTTPSDGGSTEGAETAVKSVKDWAETAYDGIVDSAKAVGDTIDVVAPQMETFLEEHPIVLEVSIPVTILTGAWVILPRVLRQIHASVEMGSAVIFQGQEGLQSEWAVPYELSVWKAMEYPARLFATLLTGFQVGMLVAPNPVLAQYLTQFWSGGSLLCIVWFLHRWKSNKFTQLLTGRQITKEERERYLAFDKFSSLGLIFIGALGLAEAAGVAVSSLLTVGGVGGIATAFAAREILSNLLTGITLSFSKPFSVGDSIKAGTVEGKVEEVGVFSTRLLTPEKNPIVVPNAFFTSQAIVNKSRAPWKYLAVKIPIYLTDFEKVPIITMGIREMLYRNSQVFLEEDKPQCHIAQFSPSVLELAITCNVKPMTRNEYLLVEQGILVEAARIITGAGATLGGQLPSSEDGG